MAASEPPSPTSTDAKRTDAKRTDAKRTDAKSPAEAGARPRPERAPGLRLHLFTVLTLFAVGAGGGYVFMHWQPEPSEEDENSPLVKKLHIPPVAEDPQALAAAQNADLKQADAFLEQGRWDEALEHYHHLEQEKEHRSDLVQYKIALSLEGLGCWDRALAAYRWVVSHAESAVARLALLGQARVLIRSGQPAEAKNILYAFLRTGGAAAPEFQSDALYLLALALAHEALPRSSGHPFEPAVVRPPLGPWKIRNLTGKQFPAAPVPATPPRDAHAPPLVIVDQGGARPAQKLVKASLTQTPAKEVLDALAGLGSLQTEWTPLALQAAVGRSTRLEIVNWPLLDVACAVAEPLGLVCQVRDKVLHVATVGEISGAALSTYRLQAAQRMLRKSVAARPLHAWTPAAYLELAACEEAQGNLPQALSWYERVVREWPRSPLRIESCYNRGMLYRRLDKIAPAEKALYQVVDHGPAHELAPLALLHIGHLHMAQADWRPALVPLRRALACAAGSRAFPAAVVSLSACYLAAGKPHEANALLLARRDYVAEPPFRATASFLDAYALYRIALARKETRREAAGLLAALLLARDDTLLGPAGNYLVGKAFRDLGMWQEVVQTYEKAAKKSTNPLIRETTFHLAEAYYMLKKPGQAVPLLTALADNQKDDWAAAARFQLAAIALQEDRPNDCLQLCGQVLQQQVLQQQLPVERGALLHLMGEAYDRLGDHHKAARCFAGEPPG